MQSSRTLPEQKSLHEIPRIQKILSFIALNYHGNPYELLNAVPSHEIWRFFINGHEQHHGYVYEATYQQIYNERSKIEKLLHIKLFGKSPLLKRVALQEYNRKGAWENSAFRRALVKGAWGRETDKRWYLTEEEAKQTVGEIINKDRGWVPYDKREKNYLLSMYTAFQEILAFQATKEPTDLSIDFIKSLHNKAMDKTEDTEFDKGSINKKGEIRATFSNFGLTGDTCSVQGLKDFLKKIEIQSENKEIQELSILLKKSEKASPDSKEFSELKDKIMLREKGPFLTIILDSNELDKKIILNALNYKEIKQEIEKQQKDFFALILSGDKKLGSDFLIPQGEETQKEVTQAFEKLILNYNHAIKKTENVLEKLDVIIQFIQDSEQLHPFLDGNCRTLCMLLLNHLLLQHGFPPVILDDPNQFDCLSLQELRQKVICGMENTIELIKKGFIYDIKTKEILKSLSQEEKDYFASVVNIDEQRRKRSP